LSGLERRTSRGGRDTIDHAPGNHDDIANAVAGVLVGLAAVDRDSGKFYAFSWAGEPISPDAVAMGQRAHDARIAALRAAVPAKKPTFTLAPGASDFVDLTPGHRLIVTASNDGTGCIEQYDLGPPHFEVLLQIGLSGTLDLGPFESLKSFRFVCSAGTLNYSIEPCPALIVKENLDAA